MTYDRDTDQALADLFADGTTEQFLARARALMGPAMTERSAGIGLACLDQAGQSANQLIRAAQEVRRSGFALPEWFPAELHPGKS